MHSIGKKTPAGEIVWHGWYGMRALSAMTQHQYACTNCEADVQGYQELLEIDDPPDARPPFVVHVYFNDVGSRIWEFATLAEAQEGWRATLSLPDKLSKTSYLPKLPTCLHADFPGQKTPWFYQQAA